MRSFSTSSDKILLTLFVLSIGLTGVFIAIPVYHAVELSFFNASSFVGDRTWAGLDNYKRVVVDPDFWNSLWVGLAFAGLAILLQVVLGILFALLLNRPFKGRAIVRGVTILPYLLPTVVVAVAFQWMLDGSFGLFTNWAMQMGLGRPAWFENPTTALGIVILISVWTWTPFVTISFLAGLQTVPSSLYEAAHVDGAGAWSRFWHITLPVLSPVLTVVVLLRSIWMFNKFDIVWLMTKGGPLGATEHLPILAYRRAFLQYDVGGGAAIATISFLILSVLIFIYFRIFPLEEKEG
ncbi:sugar ABC transporter permease [Aurantimonas sp. A2-1-M11]|uniref:carbohydrate ABC transporter permease n=1 Tax=Aurantimonas sp. A2-1-M11 TaxID=3113712 RepID=UPI002F91DF16